MKPDTAIWLAEGAEKRSRVRRMFAEIAPEYDRINGRMSMQLHHRWRQHAVDLLNLRSGDIAVDVCTGTGDFLPPLRAAVGDSGQVFGLDFCLPMLDQARAKPMDGLSIGDACRLPIQDDVCHGVTVGWGIRNVENIDEAHREIYRVLRPGGRFVSIDMAKPRNWIVRTVSHLAGSVISTLGTRLTKSDAYTYLPKSVDRFLGREDLADAMRRTGFTDVRWKDLFFGNICIHIGHKP